MILSSRTGKINGGKDQISGWKVRNYVMIMIRMMCVCANLVQSCLTLCDPMDCSLPGSSVHGSFQARVLEWGAIAFSKEVSTDLFSSSLIFSLAMLSLQMSHWRHVLFLLIWLSILDFPADSFFYTFHVSDGLAFWLFMFVFFPLEPLS